MYKDEVKEVILKRNYRSAWARGVRATAIDLLDMVDGDEVTYSTDFYNGALTSKELSYGGSLLIYDTDIAKRYCTPSELKRTHGGQREPNSRENWLDVQAMGISHAIQLILDVMLEIALLKI